MGNGQRQENPGLRSRGGAGPWLVDRRSASRRQGGRCRENVDPDDRGPLGARVPVSIQGRPLPLDTGRDEPLAGRVRPAQGNCRVLDQHYRTQAGGRAGSASARTRGREGRAESVSRSQRCIWSGELSPDRWLQFLVLCGQSTPDVGRDYYWLSVFAVGCSLGLILIWLVVK